MVLRDRKLQLPTAERQQASAPAGPRRWDRFVVVPQGTNYRAILAHFDELYEARAIAMRLKRFTNLAVQVDVPVDFVSENIEDPEGLWPAAKREPQQGPRLIVNEFLGRHQKIRDIICHTIARFQRDKESHSIHVFVLSGVVTSLCLAG